MLVVACRLRAVNGIHRQLARSSLLLRPAFLSSSIKPGDLSGTGQGGKLTRDLHPPPSMNGLSDVDPVRVREESIWHRDRGTTAERNVLADRTAAPESIKQLQAETLEHLQENEENLKDTP